MEAPSAYCVCGFRFPLRNPKWHLPAPEWRWLGVCVLVVAEFVWVWFPAKDCSSPESFVGDDVCFDDGVVE